MILVTSCSAPSRQVWTALLQEAPPSKGMLFAGPDRSTSPQGDWTPLRDPAAAAAALDRHRPSLVVVGSDTDPLERAVLSAARKRKITTLLVQTRLWLGPHSWWRLRHRARFGLRRALRQQPEPGRAADHVAVMSARFADYLVQRGVASDRVHRTGAPGWPTAAPSTVPDDLVEVTSAPYAVFAQRDLGLSVEREVAVLVHVAEMATLAGSRLVIVLDPDGAPHERWAAAAEGTGLHLATAAAGLALLPRSRACLTIGSELALDALHAGCPVGILRYLPIDGELHLGVSAIGVNYVRDLEIRLVGLLTDPALREQLVGTSPATLAEETGNSDGSAAGRLTGLLEQLAG